MTLTMILPLHRVGNGRGEALTLFLSLSLEIEDNYLIKVMETLTLKEEFIGFPY